MRKLMILAGVLAALTLVACGDGETTGDDGTVQDVIDDSGSEADVVEDTNEPDAAQDSGVDTSWMDMGIEDFVEDVPEGPFYPKEEGDLVTVSNGEITVVLNLAEGTFNIGRNPGLDGIINATSEAVVKSIEGDTTISSRNPSQRAGWEANWAPDGLDDGVTVMMETLPVGSIGGIRTFISLHRNSPSVTVKMMLALPIRDGFLVKRLSPVVARGSDGGGLLLGPNTASAMLVTNGHEIAYDGNAESLNVSEATATMNGPGYLANWNATICTKLNSCVVAGFLNVDRGFGGVAVASSPDEAFAVGDDAALSLFELRSTMVQGAYVSPSRIIMSEVAYVDFTDNASEALTRYGQAIKVFNAIPDLRPAPAMFAATVALSSQDSTQIATLIDQSVVDFHLDGILIDQGWEDDEKAPDSTTFPAQGGTNAMKALADKIKGHGLMAGIALSPFVFDSGSDFYAAHTDWMLEPTDIAIVRLGLGNTSRILDLSVPEAAAWATNYIKTAVQDWGYGYIKLYGVDLGCLGDGGSVAGQTGLTSMRDFLEGLRAELGDTVYIEIAEGSMVGLQYADLIAASMPNYASWAVPLSKLDGTSWMNAMSWSRRAFLNGTVFNVVPGRVLGNVSPRAADPSLFLAQQLSVVTGGVPNLTEMAAGSRNLFETSMRLVKAPWSPDFAKVKIPETWYSQLGDVAEGTWLTGFFRFAGNTDLYTLAATDGGRVRTFELPVDSGSWVAFNTSDGSMLSVDGKCVNPQGAELTVDFENSAQVLTVRQFDGTAPQFLGLSDTFGGGFAFVSGIQAGATEMTVTMNPRGTGGNNLWFAIPKDATPTAKVQGETVDVYTADAATCSDATIVSVFFADTDQQVIVTLSI